MANNGLLSEFSPAEVKEFKKDFMQVIKVGAEIDRYYGEARHDLDILIPKFEKLIWQFNNKYKGIKIKIRKTIDHFEVRVFLKERNIKDFFANSASRISGLKSVGKTCFGQIDVANAEKFASFLDSLLDRIYLSYTDAVSGTSTLLAAADSTEKMTEIVYNPPEIMSENSAGFRICAFYALKGGYNKKIEVYGSASTFGFTNIMDEMEKREWYDKFNPRFLE